jgi:ATP-dependent helicase/nuclease subunit A
VSDPDPRARSDDAASRRLAQTEFVRPLLLEAGAGTGKTTVLVARIVAWTMGPGWERAESGLREEARSRGSDREPTRDRIAGEVLRRVVAITFTEAAAAEMALRVAEALVAIRRGEEPPLGLEDDVLPTDASECAARARALVSGLDQLVVRTIHAYCRRLLVAHSLEAGLHPRFEVDADEGLLGEVAREVVEAALLQAYGEPLDRDYLALSSANLGPSDIEEALSALLRSATPPEALDRNPLVAERVRPLLDSLESALAAFRQVEAGRLASARGSLTAGTAEAVGETIEGLRATSGDAVDDLRRIRTLVEGRWQQKHLDRLRKWARGDFGPEERKALGAASDALALRAAPLRWALRHLKEVDPDLLDLGRRVLQPLLAEAHRALRRRGVESYAALLRDTRELLTRNPHTARRIRGEIDQLLVDEFQDTDRIQCEILRTLALEGGDAERPGLFLVGDPKQSIYGWRRADLRAYHEFAESLCRRGGRCERLSVNFRSSPVILDEVRRVVEPVMEAEEGVQPPFEHLIPCEDQRDAPGFQRAGFAPVEHWVSWQWDASDATPQTRPRARDVAGLEARALAHDLVRLNREHGVPWREIGLLFRATGDLDVYLGALREASIPYVVERDRSYYQRREIIEVSALVRCVLDPHDHLALLTVLRSALVGVPDAALIPLWRSGLPALMGEPSDAGALSAARAAALEVAASLPSEIPGLERIRGWERNLLALIEDLPLLRNSFEREPADRFVEKLRTLLLFEATESARYLGAFRLANLDRFFRDFVRALDETGGDVSTLLARLRAAVSEAREEEEGRPKDAADSAVQVTTIHKAKGLDFEHVYLMQMHKSGGRGGTGVRTPEPVERDGCWEYALFGASTPGFGEVSLEAETVASAERVRTLYVAMTRARSRLVLAGKHPTSAPAPASAGTHVDLVCHRSPARPDLEALMRELGARGEVAYLDGEGARWVFPALRESGGVAAGPATDGDAASALTIEEIRASTEELRARRREASLRAARPFHGVASDQEHQIDPEEILLRRYGGEEESGSPRAPFSEPERRVALALGSAVHGALEILDPAGDPEGEIGRCRREIRGVLSLLLGPEDLPEALARADDLWARFARGPLLERLRAIGSHVIARELPVLLPPGPGPQEPVGFVSGAIDLLYRDPRSGAIVVADYKTDRVESLDEIRRRASSYAGQGRIYLRGIREALDLEEDFRFELWFLHAGHVEVVSLGE